MLVLGILCKAAHDVTDEGVMQAQVIDSAIDRLAGGFPAGCIVYVG